MSFMYNTTNVNKPMALSTEFYGETRRFVWFTRLNFAIYLYVILAFPEGIFIQHKHLSSKQIIFYWKTKLCLKVVVMFYTIIMLLFVQRSTC